MKEEPIRFPPATFYVVYPDGRASKVSVRDGIAADLT
jgi:hypothetical protein